MPLPCDMWWMSEASKFQHFSHTNRSLACISSKSFQSKCIKVAWVGLHGLLTAAETVFEMWPALASLATNLTATQMHKHQLLAALDTDFALCRSRKESLALLFEDLFLRFIGTEDSRVRQPPKAGSVKPVKLPVPFVLVASAHLCPGTSSGMQPQELGWDHGTVDLRRERLAVSLPKWRSHLGSHNQYLQGHKPKGWRVVGLDLAKTRKS